MSFYKNKKGDLIAIKHTGTVIHALTLVKLLLN